MRFKVLEPFKSITPEGEIELQPGQVIALKDREIAFRLISKSKITPIERVAYKVWSEILQAYLWVVDTDEDMYSLRSKGVSEAIYSHEEIRRLKGLCKDSIKEIHKVKEIFKDSKIEDIKLKEGDHRE